jgi:hypothetical protein
MAKNWNPEDHPRFVQGRFGLKAQTGPETELTPVTNIADARVLKALGRARNLLDEPLSDIAQERVLGYLNEPTENGWEEIHGTLLTRKTTLWQALLEHTYFDLAVGPTRALSDTTPYEVGERSGWEQIPTAAEVERAIIAATDPNAAPAQLPETDPTWDMWADGPLWEPEK